MSTDRILFVEDNALVGRALHRAVVAAGLHLEVAGPDEALSFAEKNRYAVVLSDYNLGDTTAFDVLARLRPLQPDAIFALISARMDFDLAATAVNQHGVRFVVTKPWRNDDLLDVLRRALALAQKRSDERLRIDELSNRAEELSGWNARLERLLAKGQGHVLDAVLDVVTPRAPQLLTHGRRVGVFVQEICSALAIDDTLRRATLDCALVHDLSILSVPEKILLKPGPLQPEEMALVRAHIDVGQRLLQKLGMQELPAEIFAQHHERWDGLGYARGKSGTDIHLGARIFAAAETLAALTSDRPYREKSSIESACNELRRSAGTHLDPDVVAAIDRIPIERLRLGAEATVIEWRV